MPSLKPSRTVSANTQNLVLEEFKRYVGKECPTNAEIAESLRLATSTVTHALSSLCAKKLLTRKSGKNKRVIIINETGLTTLPGTLRKMPGERSRKQWDFTDKNHVAATPRYQDARIVTRTAPNHADIGKLMPAMRKVGV